MAEAAIGRVEDLSEREQKCLDHLRQARDLGVSFAEYCRSFELDLGLWYRVKQKLAHKGVPEAVSARAKAPKVVEEKEPAPFARVHIAEPCVVPVPPPPAVIAIPVACRIVHPSGWVLECGTLPQASWLATVLAGPRP